jgi:anti-anti-sigma factor
MADVTPADLLEVGQTQGVTVVRFTRRTILDPALIEQIGQRLLALVQEHGCRKLVLDFTRVESVTSAMMGTFISLYHTIDDDGGRLAFCGVDPFLQQIFHVCNIPPGIPIHPSEAEAVGAVAGA